MFEIFIDFLQTARRLKTAIISDFLRNLIL